MTKQQTRRGSQRRNQSSRILKFTLSGCAIIGAGTFFLLLLTDHSANDLEKSRQERLHQQIEQHRNQHQSEEPFRTIQFFETGLTVQLPTDYLGQKDRPSQSPGLTSMSTYYSYGDAKSGNQLVLGSGYTSYYGVGESPLETVLNESTTKQLLQESDVSVRSVQHDQKGVWNGFSYRDIRVQGEKNLFAGVRLILIEKTLYIFEATWTPETAARANAYFESIEFNPDFRPREEFYSTVTSDWLDLLPLIDLTEDSRDGKWIRLENGIVSPPDTTGAVLTLPVDVPEAYELRIELQRAHGTESFNIGLPIAGSMGMVVIDGFEGKFSGLGVVSGKILQGRRDAVSGTFLTSLRSELHVSVLPNSIQVTCDGKQVVNWQGEPNELSIRKEFWNYQEGRLFLGCWASEFVIRSARIRGLSPDAMPQAD